MIDCADNCTWSENVTVNGNVTINGSGGVLNGKRYLLWKDAGRTLNWVKQAGEVCVAVW